MERIPLDTTKIPAHPISRLAPTPSGFLHLGNAVNFLVAWALVRRSNGTLFLRIDDMDGIRFRGDVLEDIFASLAWLGLDWDMGPSGPTDFLDHFSLQANKAHYWERLRQLKAVSGRVFTCECSRSAIKKASPNGLYPGTCRGAGHEYRPGQNAVRLQVDGDARIRVNGSAVGLAETFGDFVIWRRDDQPSYQLASLLEDEKAGTNLVVRGEDLLDSTAAQLYLAGLFGFTTFPSACFIHHGLVMGEDGKKLSKSRGAHALKDIRDAGGGPETAVRAAAPLLGLSPDEVHRPRDLLQGGALP